MNSKGSQLEGSTKAVKWSMCLEKILPCNDSLLVKALDLLSIGLLLLQ